MALWRWTDLQWEKVNWERQNRQDRAILYGCGPSLRDADPIEKGATRFVQNNAYKLIEPHIWLGMDLPEHFGNDVFTTPYKKIVRGSHSKNLINDIPVASFGETYFADTSIGGLEKIWNSRGIDISFAWAKNTMTIALHLILWMGFKEIVFSGIDLGGPYFDNANIPSNYRHNLLFQEEYSFLKQFAEQCKSKGIVLINRSKTSRLKSIMETIN